MSKANEAGGYKPSAFLKIAIVASLMASSLLIASAFNNLFDGGGGGINSESQSVPVSQDAVDGIPPSLPFGADVDMPITTQLALIVPSRPNWSITNQNDDGTMYVYTDSNNGCTARTELRHANFSGYAKDEAGSRQASLASLSNIAGTSISSSSEHLTINDVQYNFGSNAQALSTGYSIGPKHSAWSFVRALLPLDTYFALSVVCDNGQFGDQFFEYSDNVRGQFGFAARP